MNKAYIDDYQVQRKLNKAADIIEAVCYNAHMPLEIGEDDIVVLGDQCRFYAYPITKGKALENLQLRLIGKIDHNYEANNIFHGKNLKKLQDNTKTSIKAYLRLTSSARFGISVGDGAVIFDFSLQSLLGYEFFSPLPLESLGLAEKNHIPIGKTLNGEIVVVNNESPQHHHIGIYGASRSGKTVLANTLLYGLTSAYTPEEYKIFMASWKLQDIALWRGLPHLLSAPTTDPDMVMNILRWVEAERQKRSKMHADEKSGLPRLLIYLGEISGLANNSTDEFGNLLGSIARLGASERIHLIISTQRPKGDAVGKIEIKSQMSLKFCGRMDNPTDAYLALGTSGSNAQYLPGMGAFITNNDTRFQAAFIADEEMQGKIKEHVAKLRATHGEAEYLDITPETETVSERANNDLLEAMRQIKSDYNDGMEATSANRLCIMLGWGSTRAARTWENLKRRNIVDDENRNDQNRAPVDIDKLEKEMKKEWMEI